MATRFEARYEATPRTVGLMRNQIAELARDGGFDEPTVADVRLAVSEAATNALVHGVAQRDAGTTIHVEAELLGDELIIGITDDGGGMRPRSDSPGLGLGLSVMAMVAKRLEIVEARPGTQVRMAFAPHSH
jgi:serine/threonine-protein kinase RsbW